MFKVQVFEGEVLWNAVRKHRDIRLPSHRVFVYMLVPTYAPITATPVYAVLAPAQAPAPPAIPPVCAPPVHGTPAKPPVRALPGLPMNPPPAATHLYNDEPTGYPMLDRDIYLDPVRGKSTLERPDKKAA